jgi:CheY-like chemotaxis protein
MMTVIVFDDVVAARGEVFDLPGMAVAVHAHADDAVAVCTAGAPPDLVCMDYAMGADHVDGEAAIVALRAAGFRGRILATSSDPAMNARMCAAGADEALAGKALLRPYLAHLASRAGAPVG